MLTVACVLKGGGVYDADWVARLRAGVAKHLPIEHRFICITELDVTCDRVPLRHYWPGWWSKIELFRLKGPVLFFDLDTLIVGDLSDIVTVALRTPFACLDNFMGLGIGSGVMAWNGDADLSVIHRRFCEDPAYWMGLIGHRGDQGFIEEAYGLPKIERLQNLVPDQIVSYREHNCQHGVHHKARVMCLHGRPKFTDMHPTHWARRKWEALA